MKQPPYLLYTAVALVVILAVAVVWLLTAELGSGRAPAATPQLRTGTCPGLDLRYGYDPAVFAPAPYDGHAEFPLRLDAEHFSFYGKRIRGIGKILQREPASLLYDFVGSQDAEVFEKYYGLKKTEEVYEDAKIEGKLGLHTRLTFQDTKESKDWPRYFPDRVKAGKVAHLEGWVLFSAEDLFYFYAVAAKPLTDAERAACTQVLDSLEFSALTGSGEVEPEGAQRGVQEPPKAGQPPDAAGGDEKAPPGSPQAPVTD
jgi:hypothetical protein